MSELDDRVRAAIAGEKAALRKVLHLQHEEHKLRSTIALLKTKSQRTLLELSALRDDLASSIQAKEEAERRMEQYRQKHMQADIKMASVRWRKQVQAEVNALRIELAQQQQTSVLKDQQLEESRKHVAALRRQLQQQHDDTQILRAELDTHKMRLKESKNRASMVLAQRTRASIAEISSLLRSIQDVKIQVSSVQSQCANMAEHVQRTDAAVASLSDRDMSNIKARQRRIGDALITMQEQISSADTNGQFQLVPFNDEMKSSTFATSASFPEDRGHALDLHSSHLDTDASVQTNNNILAEMDDAKALRKVADELYLNLQAMTQNNPV